MVTRKEEREAKNVGSRKAARRLVAAAGYMFVYVLLLHGATSVL